MDLVKIGEGRQADVYAWGDDTAVKVYRSDVDQALAEAEAAVTAAVHGLGAPVPRCDGIVDVNGRRGIVLERMDGPVMAEALLADPDTVSAELGRLHAALHDLDGDDFPSVAPRMAVRARRGVPDHLWPAVAPHFEDLADGDRLVHGDLHPANVMRHGGAWRIIDWDGAYRGDPTMDVARTLFLLQDADLGDLVVNGDVRWGAATAYLLAYREHRPIADADLTRWRIPVLAARLDEGIPAERDHVIGLIRQELRRV